MNFSNRRTLTLMGLVVASVVGLLVALPRDPARSSDVTTPPSSHSVFASAEAPEVEGPPPLQSTSDACAQFTNGIRATSDPDGFAKDYGFAQSVTVPDSFRIDRLLCWGTSTATRDVRVVHAIAAMSPDGSEAVFLRTNHPLDEMTDEDWSDALADNGFPAATMEEFGSGFATGLAVGEPTVSFWEKLKDRDRAAQP